MTHRCISCRNLPGCKLVVGLSGEADANKFLVGESETCDRWARVSGNTLFMRQVNYKKFGSAVLRAIHTMKPPNEDEEEDLEVDFLSMIGDGITYKARRDQLRFITTEDGAEFILDSREEKKPRGSYPLRKYATDASGPVQATDERVALMTTPDLIKLILEAEKAAGLVIPANEMKKQKKAATESTVKPTKEVRKMGKISIRKGSKPTTLPNKVAGGSKAAKPATSKKVDTGNDEAAPEDAAPAVGGEMDVSAFVAAVVEEVAKLNADQLKAIKKDLKGVVNSVEGAVSELRAAMTKQHTVQHDVLLQHIYTTLGTLNEALAETNLDEVQLLPQGYDIEAYDAEPEGDQSGES